MAEDRDRPQRMVACEDCQRQPPEARHAECQRLIEAGDALMYDNPAAAFGS